MRVAINGFGRIGRAALRIITERSFDDLEVVAINDITDAKTLAHLLKYDSVHGAFGRDVSVDEGALVVGERRYDVLAERDPAALPWKERGVELVLECSGVFRTRATAGKHLEAGARLVVISAPSKDADATFVMGINHETFDPEKHKVVSNASCTTNCLAPVAKVLHETFGIERGLMTTIHSYTNDQRILDLPHSDLRRARAAAMSMIPTSTGAAKAVALVLPELEGRINGVAVRVPTPNVSLVDLVADLQREATVETVNAAMKAAAEGPLAGVLQYTDEPVVSIDLNHNPHSSIFDSGMTQLVQDRMVKVFAWYDNEWGFANRMVELARHMGQA